MVSRGRPDLRGARRDLSDRRPFVIFNPASGRGRGAKRLATWRALLDEHLGEYGHAVTERAGEEYVLADRAMDEGYDLIVAVGGDGTWSHVADRVASRDADVAFGVLPAGTGNDFGRNLNLSFSDPEAAVRALAAGRERKVDIGVVRTPSAPTAIGRQASGGVAGDSSAGASAGSEAPRPRHFLNVIGIGFDVAVIDAAASARFLRGELLYKVTGLQQLFRFPGAHLRAGDSGNAGARDGVVGGGAGSFRRDGAHLMVTVSNGRWFGGGFPIAPDGRIDDGLLHGCFIGDATPLQRLRLFGLAEKGRHVGDPRVEMRTSARFRFEFEAPIRFEADGDVFRTEGNALELEVRPGALTLVGA